jgi:hypothetical protein
MRVLTLIASATIGLSNWHVEAEAACNARLQFCSYPTWAANAFSSQGGQKPYYASGYPEVDIAPLGYAGVTAYSYVPAYGYVVPNVYPPAYGYQPARRYEHTFGYAPAYGYVGPRHVYIDRR